MKKKPDQYSSEQAKEDFFKDAFIRKLKNVLILSFPAFIVTMLPLFITRNHWLRVFEGGLPRAWDGSGHFAIAQIYTNNIFPDTFGWIDNFFAGMPFPNFYPPLFYWLIALLSKAGIFSFLTSFKIIVCLPVIFMPATFWFVAWKISEGNRVVATFTSLFCVWLSIDYHFVSAAFPLGLDYFSTFQIGLYAQPLGFILLLIWLFVYQNETLTWKRASISSILLALVILANFFCAITACVFIFARLVSYMTEYIFRTINPAELWRKMFAQFGLSILAVSLAAFWLVPMLNQSEYFVTRPTQVSFFPSPAIWFFYISALLGCIVWLKNDKKQRFYVIACVCLGLSIFLISPLAPGWLPFQTNRFLANFNFLLCLPVAFIANFLFEKFNQIFVKRENYIHQLKYAGFLIIVGLSILLIESPKYELAFYSVKEFGRIKSIFDFARENTKGRYLVENPDPNYPLAQLDGRAINSYIGMQGGKTANIVFRESSPNSLFFNPLLSVFSAYPENYGISSVLADDLDFKDQSVEKHLERAKFLGVKYLVIISPWVKEKLLTAGLKENKFGAWSVFEILQQPPYDKQDLVYKPALVLSDFSLKARKSNDLSFLRLAEEQFNEAWFDVMLAHDPQNSRIDEVTELQNFGAIIIEKFKYNDEQAAFEILKTYSQTNLVILIRSDNNLFRQIETRSAEFGNLQIFDYPVERDWYWLKNEFSNNRYNSSQIRFLWKQIKQNLETHKIAINDKKMIQEKKSFHPNWQTENSRYISTPFFALTSNSKTETSRFGRTNSEIVGLYISLIALVVCFFNLVKAILFKS